MVYESINAAVKDSGIKQKYIAERVGITESMFSAMLAGRRKVDVDEFFKLCQVLGKTPEQLYNYRSEQS